MKKKIIIAVVNSILLVVILFGIQFINARKNAIDYVSIVNVNSTQYENVKIKIQNIVSEDVRTSLFDSNIYLDSKYLPIRYKIHSIKGRMVGYRDYTFFITWTKYATRTITITSCIEIVNGKVVNAFRVDEQ